MASAENLNEDAEPERQGDFDPMSDPDERQHLLSVLDSFRSYRRLAHFNGTHVRRQAFYSLPSDHWTLLSEPPFSVLDSLNHIDDLIDSNAELSEAIFMAGFRNFMAPTLDSEWAASVVPKKIVHDEFKVFSFVMDHLKVQAMPNDLDKARSCINQFYREWSAEGRVEREKCFDPVIQALEEEFQSRAKLSSDVSRSDINVLVPGAGLGRLVFDICRSGFTVEGNEISYHELMASYLTLNHTKNAGQFKIAPWALNSSNHRTQADQFRTYAIPDVHPESELAASSEGSDAPASDRMSMSMGDFCVIYKGLEYRDTFDAVATVFFIDTAPNIIRYIEAVRNCLKPGGIWINLGPLLWHHAARPRSVDQDDEPKHKPHSHEDTGIADPGAVELLDDQVVALVQHFGFTMEKHEADTISTGYMSNPHSMLRSTYYPSFWIARKK